MRKDRYKIRNFNAKTLTLVLAVSLSFVLLICGVVGGTLAWLTAETETVTNTFTSAKLFDDPSTEFTLWEHLAVDTDGDGKYELDRSQEVKANTYDILPGVDIPKDPTVDIVDLKESAYLYITVDAQLPTTMGYSIDPAYWEQLDGYTNVWVYNGSYSANNVIPGTDSGTALTVPILTGNVITVLGTYEGFSGDISISFKAYMAQATGNGSSAEEAWNKTFPSVGTKTNP